MSDLEVPAVEPQIAEAPPPSDAASPAAAPIDYGTLLEQGTPGQVSYGDLLEPSMGPTPVVDLQKEREQRLRATLLGAQKTKVEEAAKVVDLSRKTGLPPALVERNMQKVDGEQKISDYAGLLDKSPMLSQWLLEDEMNAKVAQKDFRDLSWLEHTFNNLFWSNYYSNRADANQKGMNQAQLLISDLEAAIVRRDAGEPLSAYDQGLLKDEADIRDTARQAIIDYGMEKYRRQQQGAELPKRPNVIEMEKASKEQDFGKWFDAFMKDPWGAFWDMSIQSVYNLPAQLAAGAVAGPVGVFTASFYMEYWGAVNDALEAHNVDINDPTQLMKAFADPELMAKVKEQASIKASTIGTFDALSFGLASKFLGFGKKAVTRVATNIPAQFLVQGAAGGAGEAAGSYLAGLPIDIHSVAAEVMGEAIGSPVEVATARWRDAHRADMTAKEWGRISELPPLERQAAIEAFSMDRLIEIAGNTQIGKNSPEKLQEFIQTLVKDGGGTVFVPAEAVMTFMQDMTGLQAEQFAASLGITEQLGRIAATNEDVAIPLEKYVTGASEAHKAWREQIRTEVDGFSIKQAQEFEKAKAAELKELQDRFEEQIQAGIVADPQTIVYQQVLAMAKANGYTNEVAAQHAALYASRYAARAARNPERYADALDAFQQAGPGTGMTIQTVLPDGTRAMGPDVFDTMLDSIRSGKDPIVPPAHFAHLEARKEAQKAALEPVLGPEPAPDAPAPPTPKQVAEARNKAAMEAFKAQRQEVADALASMGLDPATMTNQQIRDAVARKVEGQTFQQAIGHNNPPLTNSELEDALSANALLDPSHPSNKPRSRRVKDVAAELQARGQAALRALGIKSGRIEGPNPETDALLSRVIASEIQGALRRDAKRSALDWYTHKVREAMAIAAVIYPEIATDPHAKFAFTVALAVTSQGEIVPSNVRLTDIVYSYFREHGRFPTDVQAKETAAINGNFVKMNALLDTLGEEGTREFMSREFTVAELEGAGYDIGGELVDTTVRGSAILGPKIGGGFFQNLNGNYDPVTMDLWFMRAWGRLTGTLVGKVDISSQKARFVAALEAAGEKASKRIDILSRRADAIVAEHESNFRKYREEYDSGVRVKSELVNAAQRLQAGLSGINQSPTSGGQRNWMRNVVAGARALLAENGMKMTPADLQAVWWYPEKELYGKLGGKGRASDEINVDYAGSLRELALTKPGIDAATVDSAVRALDDGPGPAFGANDQGGSRGGSQEGRGANGQEGTAAGVGETYQQPMVETPAFKEWFGDSKIVDGDGNPLVVYKAMQGDTPNMQAQTGLTHVALDRSTAEQFATNGRPVRSVYVRASNPFDFRVSAHIAWLISKITPAVVRDYNAQMREIMGADYEHVETRRSLIALLEDGSYGAYETPVISSLIKANGYDAIYMTESADPRINLAVFDPGQIRLADQFDVLQQESRGEITFADNITTISLFQARDLSTLAHETGHLWLAELESDAKSASASDQIKGDWATVLKFLGSDGYITREQHELFARAFETYLMEGKAPTEGLRGVFRSFKNWLVGIYRNLARLQAPISPEMREVFDRLIATDEEIASARDVQGFNPVFTDAKSAGMTEAEFAAYTKRVTQVVDAAEEAVLAKVMATIRRQKTKEVAAEKSKIRKEVTEEMMKDPGNAALHLLRTGMLYGSPVTPMSLVDAKLSRAALVAIVGEEGLQRLPRGIYASEGLDPNDLAQVFGLGNGQELVERLMQIQAETDAMRAKGDNRSPLNARIAEETQRRLTESLGDPLNDGSIEAEAMAAIHSDKQGALLSSELKVLARKAGHSGTITLDDLKAWASNTIGEMSVYQATQASKYQRAERMAGQAVQRALIKGDFVAAFKAKQDQLVNFALYTEAKKAAQEAESIRKLADRYASAATIKSMDQGALEQIHQLLEQYDFKRRSGALLAERTTFSAWAAEQAAQGFEVIEPPRLKGADRVHFSQMTMDEIRGLGDTIKQIAHIGRWKQEMVDGAKKRAFEEIVAEAVDTAGKIDQRGVSQMRRGTTSLQDMLGSFASQLRSIDAALLKMETIFEWLDNDKTGRGVFSRVVFRRIADAQVKERDLQKDLAGKMQAIYDKVPAEQRKAWSTQHTIPELGVKLNQSQIIAVALNMGNDSNMQKMLSGEKWDEAAVRQMLDKHLSKEEWQFVQDTWDLIETLWPETEALEKRVNGVAPPKVEATPVQTPHGTLRGGYYPMAYDKAGDIKADRIASKSAEGLFDPEYRRASTRAGSTNKRTEGFNAKVLLSLNVIGSHLNEVAHDLAFREAVMDSFKFLSDDRVREAIRSAVGPEYEKQTQVWLKAVANEWAVDRRGLEGIDKFLQTARANTAVVGMGFRVSTMFSQVAGFANSIQRLGSASMMAGIRDFYKDPAGMAAFVRERSGEMRHRANDLERDIRLALKRMEGKDGNLDAVRRFAFRGIALFDAAVSLPTWMGAYSQGLKDGMTEAEAIAYGDKMVRDTQGAGSVKDLSAFQRGGEALKLLGMFYSYFNVYYNRQRGIVRDARAADSFSDYMDVVGQGMWLMVVPTLLSALLSGQGPEDDEEWWLWATRNVGFGVFSGIPWARDIGGSLSNQIAGKGFGGAKLSPVQGIGEGIQHLFTDAAHLVKGEETSKSSIKNLFNVVGLFTALPTGQLGATTQFVWDALADGSQNPEGLLDWLKGLAYGPKKQK